MGTLLPGDAGRMNWESCFPLTSKNFNVWRARE